MRIDKDALCVIVYVLLVIHAVLLAAWVIVRHGFQ
jgi:hypothetical protein